MDFLSGQSWSKHDVNLDQTYSVENITWCTVSPPEQHKCENFAKAVERDNIRVGYTYFRLQCKQVIMILKCYIYCQ